MQSTDNEWVLDETRIGSDANDFRLGMFYVVGRSRQPVIYGWDFPHSNFNLLMGLNNSFGDMLLNFVLGMMFIVLPTVWISALAWVGIHAGGIVQNLATAIHDAKAAGSRGGSAAITLAKGER